MAIWDIPGKVIEGVGHTIESVGSTIIDSAEGIGKGIIKLASDIYGEIAMRPLRNGEIGLAEPVLKRSIPLNKVRSSSGFGGIRHELR